MNSTATFDAIKYDDGLLRPVTDCLTVEEALQVSINGVAYTVTMRSPGDDYHLVRGLLLTEGIYTDRETGFDSFVETRHNKAGLPLKIDVRVDPSRIRKPFENSRSYLSASSCGLCGKRELEDIDVNGRPIECDQKLDLGLIEPMFARMRARQNAFEASGGSHASAAFSIDGQMLSIMEDIGRHNAVDKVIGELVESKTLDRASCLLVSGRISYEIVAKAFMARIPFLAAVSAPSSLAVETAESAGICIIGFCRNGKATAYSMRSRIWEGGGHV